MAVADAVRTGVFRDGEKCDSTTVVLTFKEDNLPECVFVGCFFSFKVHPYQRPLLRCCKCQRYGHIAAACQGTRRCGKCGGERGIHDCEAREFKCGSCGGDVAGSRECKMYKQARSVQQYREVNKGVPYAEALRRVGKGEAGGKRMGGPAHGYICNRGVRGGE